MSTKSQIRREISKLLSSLNEIEKKQQSNVVLNKLIDHPDYKRADRVSIYLSTANEIDTKPILKQALEVDKKRCFIPLVLKKSIKGALDIKFDTRMVMYELRSMNEYEQLPLNHYGIKEPDQIDGDDRIVSDSLDLIVTPGVAFDLSGRRLGHGKGYYDEFLTHWTSKRSPDLYSIGVAFKEQILSETELPFIEGSDFRLNEVLTGQQE